MRLPTTHKRVVWHVGHLDRPWYPGKSRGVQVEGTGLAVSEFPETWRGIARLGRGIVWECRPLHLPGKFVDFHALSERQQAQLADMAIDAGWLIPIQKYRVESYDAEGEETYRDYDTLQEASGNEGSDELAYTIVPGYTATSRLRTLWKDLFGKALGGFATELGQLLVLEAMNKYDGVWWYDVYVRKLSAPRGMIFQSRLAQWRCVPAQTWPQGSPDEIHY